MRYQRFKEARDDGRPKAELLAHLNAAADAYQQALDLLPENAVGDLAVLHYQLGLIYAEAGELDTARVRPAGRHPAPPTTQGNQR